MMNFDKAKKPRPIYIAPFTLNELLVKDFPVPRWIVEELIPFGITAISGISGRGKTWVAHEIALRVASGESLFGQFATSQMPVLIIDKENVGPVLKDRFVLLGATQEQALPIYFLSMDDTLIDPEHINAISAFCRMYGVGLVIFDSLIRFHRANENDASEMSQVFEDLKVLSKNNISAIFIQHQKKEGRNQSDPATSMRGSSDILAAVDAQLSVDKQGDYITVKQNKLRIAKELDEDIQLMLDSSDPDRVYIKYVGGVRKRGRTEEKMHIAIRKVLELGPLNQAELFERLKEAEVKIGKRSLPKYLNHMVAVGLISFVGGERNSKIYSLIDHAHDGDQ